MRKWLSNWSLETCVLVVFVMELLSSFYYKQLYRDGSSWVYRLMNHQTWVLDYPFLRYSSTIVQTPAVLAAKFGLAPLVVTWIYCFGYFIYPFISLLILRKYLIKNDKQELMVPLCLSFFLTIIPTWAFANSISSEAIVIFWFLYTYIIVSEKPHLGIMTVISSLLLLSYESAAIFFLLSLWILWREKKLKKTYVILFSVMMILQGINLSIIVMPENGHRFFAPSILPSLKSPIWLSFFVFIMGVVLYQMKFRKFRPVILSLGIVIISYALFRITGLKSRTIWHQSYINRVWSIPFSFILLLAFYEFHKLRTKTNDISFRVFLLLCVLPALYWNLRLSLNASMMMKRISAFVKTQEGCKVLSIEKQLELRGDSFMPAWDFPYLTIILGGKKKIDTLIIRDFESDKPKVFCEISSNRLFIEYDAKFNRQQIPINGWYNFSELIKK